MNLLIFLALVIAYLGIELDAQIATGKFNTQSSWNSTYTDKLKRALLTNYDKFARPMEHFNKTSVTLGITIRHIELDTTKPIFTVYGWFKMQWNDEKLIWNPADYGNLTTLHVADHEVWQPDIALYNSATGSATDHFGNTHILVRENGSVLWVPPSQFPVFCQLNLKNWPFDKQSCELKLGSWTYSGEHIDIEVDNPELDILVQNHEWKVSSVSVKKITKIYACCPEPYMDATYTFNLERRSSIFETVIIGPATIVILLTLLTFWLPPFSGEKIILNGIVALLISLFLLYFSQKLPVMALETPLVVKFYSTSLYLVAFSTIICTVVLNISRNKHVYGVPRFIKSNLDGFLGTILGLNHFYAPPVQAQRTTNTEELRENAFEDHTSSDDHHMLQPIHKGASQYDWILLATAIDRLAFVVFSLLFAVLAFADSV